MICYVDGGYDNIRKCNPYCSFKVYDNDGNLLQWDKKFSFIDAKTNNEAEYWALIRCLGFLAVYGDSAYDNTIYSDSKLLVNQVQNLWKINYPRLRELKDIVDGFKFHWSIVWLPREIIVKELGH
jgi:ribonuclease HI